MLLLSTSCKYRRQLLTVSRRFSTKFNFSSSPSQTKLNPPDKDCEEFLPWLEKKAGAEISSKLYIGKSSYGRSLFASRHIRNGDCILEVPFNLQIAPDNLPPDVKDALVDEVDHVTKVAMVLLAEWKQGKDSRWAPYISCLPRLEEMHSTIFWTENELDMIRASSVYEETIQQKAHIGNDFLKIRLVLENFPDIFGSVTYEDFMHAYALVKSRAWGTPKGVSLIPFADFMNHDGVSEAIVLNDESKQVSEVIADCDYAPQEEVQISYGKFGNATLMLNFGFTVPHNIHDQVEIQMDISDDDLLHETKKQILQKHQLPTTQGPNDTEPSSWNRFAIREVKTATGKGKGIPQSLRAFARVVSCNHPKDLCDLAAEAAQNDGRLARRPFEDSNREIRAHSILLSHLIRLIDQYHASIQCLDHWSCVSRHPNRMQMALNFLAGELRILESASTWLGNYCTTLSEDSLH
ncbi:Ribulose-1,5 bisphosphate carboxylase/oxygenase large subunit N-methyltransferase, chloroplastic [Linum grandiflorum]